VMRVVLLQSTTRAADCHSVGEPTLVLSTLSLPKKS
jgi:hypothetical protein